MPIASDITSDQVILTIGAVVAGLLIISAIAYFLDTLDWFYFRKVKFSFEDIEIIYSYKWQLFTQNDLSFYISRKIEFKNLSTNMVAEHIIDPVKEKGHVIYLYLDENYCTHTGMLFDVIVIRDTDVSMGFDRYSLDYMDNHYVYKKRDNDTKYIGMIERGVFYKSDGHYRNVKSKELNY